MKERDKFRVEQDKINKLVHDVVVGINSQYEEGSQVADNNDKTGESSQVGDIKGKHTEDFKVMDIMGKSEESSQTNINKGSSSLVADFADPNTEFGD
jgi:hypothetical protein